MECLEEETKAQLCRGIDGHEGSHSVWEERAQEFHAAKVEALIDDVDRMQDSRGQCIINRDTGGYDVRDEETKTGDVYAGDHFLNSKETLLWFRKELDMAGPVIDRDTYDFWKTQGKKSAWDRT